MNTKRNHVKPTVTHAPDDHLGHCRAKMDEIHTQMSRLQRAIVKRGAKSNPNWADAGDLGHLVNLLTVAADWAEME
jgi:hypothetical protein